MDKIIIRHDDYDFRLSAGEYLTIHNRFVEMNLVETAVLQFTQNGNLTNIDPDLVKAMREGTHWDFQIHGWSHAEYDCMDLSFIVRDLSACMYQCYTLFGVMPTVWYPPWNRLNVTMERAAAKVGLRIDNESYDIAKFVREAKSGHYNGHSLYFHGWKADEMTYFTEMLQLVKEVNAKNESSSI